MSIPSTAVLSQRLTSLSSLILERSRVVSLKLPPSPSTDAEIVRSLKFVRDGLKRIEDQARRNGGSAAGPISMETQKSIQDLARRYDHLLDTMEEDNIGREKVKGLRRIIPEPVPAEQANSTPTSLSSTPRAIPDLQILPPTPHASTFSHELAGDDDDDFVVHPSGTVPAEQDPLFNPDRRGSYDPDEAEEEREMISDQQLLESQNGLMQEQDARLDLLSHSINRHHHMSLQIGDELDLQNEMLDDTDARLDGTAARMGRARGRLDKVAKSSKEHMSMITIVALIVILLLLIIVFKT